MRPLFLKDCITYFFLNFICNHSLSLICLWLHMNLIWTSNKVDMHSFQNRRMKVLEKLCPIERKLKLNKLKSTDAQCTMRPNFRKYLISSNMLIFDSYAVIFQPPMQSKVPMQSTFWSLLMMNLLQKYMVSNTKQIGLFSLEIKFCRNASFN